MSENETSINLDVTMGACLQAQTRVHTDLVLLIYFRCQTHTYNASATTKQPKLATRVTSTVLYNLSSNFLLSSSRLCFSAAIGESLHFLSLSNRRCRWQRAKRAHKVSHGSGFRNASLPSILIGIWGRGLHFSILLLTFFYICRLLNFGDDDRHLSRGK